MAPQDDLTAERAAYIYAKLGRGSMPDIRTIGAALKTARQEALREAREKVNSRFKSVPTGLLGAGMQLGLREALAELDRLASEGGGHNGQ